MKVRIVQVAKSINIREGIVYGKASYGKASYGKVSYTKASYGKASYGKALDQNVIALTAILHLLC